MIKLLITIIFPVMLFVTGCSLLPKPHRIDIQQGNIITQDDVNQLKTGMNKKQVLFVMGSPIINDTFHANRWDYYYSHVRNRTPDPTIHVSLLFMNDRLVTINGDMQPIPQADTLDKGTRNKVITITPKTEKVGLSGLIDSMIDAIRSDDEKPVTQPKTITKPQSPATPGQEEEKSGGFFDSFINFFKGDASDEPEATSSPTEPASKEKQAEQKPSGPVWDLDAFTNIDSGKKDHEPETSTTPAEPISVEQDDSEVTPDTSSGEKPPEPEQSSGSGWNLDSFIKPYSSDKDASEQQDNSTTEQPAQ